jgi:hypothetical protein
MKIRVSSGMAACIAGCALFATTLIGTGCVSSLATGAKQKIVNEKSWFNFQLAPTANSAILRLTVEKPIGKVVWIALKTHDGYDLENFSTQKRDAGINRNFNFADAEDGSYIFEVTDGVTTQTKTVNVKRIVAQPVVRMEVK